MELSDVDKKMILRLRRKHQQFLRWRWWLLATGVFCLGVVGYSFSVLMRFFDEPDLGGVLVIACLLPQLYLGGIFGAGLVAYTWANWNGNPQTRLLLRLLDEKLES